MNKMEEIHIVATKEEFNTLLEIIKIDIGSSLSLLQSDDNVESIKKLANRLSFTIKLFGLVSKVS